MRIVLVFVFFMLAGCATVTPYYEVGIGHTLDSGSYVAQIGAAEDRSKFIVPLEEKCAIGFVALGVQLEYDIDVELAHTSCFNHKPEIVQNSILIKKRGFFK